MNADADHEGLVEARPELLLKGSDVERCSWLFLQVPVGMAALLVGS